MQTASGERSGGTPAFRIRVGVDPLGVSRMARFDSENPGIRDDIFTVAELSYCLGKRRCFEHMAARFAAKGGCAPHGRAGSRPNRHSLGR